MGLIMYVVAILPEGDIYMEQPLHCGITVRYELLPPPLGMLNVNFTATHVIVAEIARPAVPGAMQLSRLKP